jgi:hypothetical protein
MKLKQKTFLQTEPEVLIPSEPSKHAYIRSLSDEQKTGFRPALPSYYDPVAHSNVNDRIQQVWNLNHLTGSQFQETNTVQG